MIAILFGIYCYGLPWIFLRKVGEDDSLQYCWNGNEFIFSISVLDVILQIVIAFIGQLYCRTRNILSVRKKELCDTQINAKRSGQEVAY